MAHRLAVASDRVTADVIEISEYPDMAQKYNVSGVPKIVINDRVEFVGALPEPRFVAEMLKAVKKKS